MLHKYFPDWQLTQGGYEEEYSRDKYKLYFCSARCTNESNVPVFTYYISCDNKIIFLDTFVAEDLKKNREGTMSIVKQKVQDVTGLIDITEEEKEIKYKLEKIMYFDNFDEFCQNIDKIKSYNLLLEKDDTKSLKELYDLTRTKQYKYPLKHSESEKCVNIGFSIRLDHVECLKHLLNGKENIQTLIQYSSIFGSMNIMKFLFEQKNGKCTSDVLIQAIHFNNIDIVKYFFELQNKYCQEKKVSWKDNYDITAPFWYGDLILYDVCDQDYTKQAIEHALELRRLILYKSIQYRLDKVKCLKQRCEIVEFLFDLQKQTFGEIPQKSQGEYETYLILKNELKKS